MRIASRPWSFGHRRRPTSAWISKTPPGGPLATRSITSTRNWQGFLEWARASAPSPDQPFEVSELDAPVQRPRQVFAIGLNYLDHAAESGCQRPCVAGGCSPSFPPVWSARPPPSNCPASALTGKSKLAVVIGRTADRVSEDDAWNHVAGVTVGTRHLGTGPANGRAPCRSSRWLSLIGLSVRSGLGLVTPDALENRDDLELQCSVAGRVLQKGRTSQMVFSVSETHRGDLSRVSDAAG